MLRSSFAKAKSSEKESLFVAETPPYLISKTSLVDSFFFKKKEHKRRLLEKKSKKDDAGDVVFVVLLAEV